MRLRFTILGYEILELELTRDEPAEDDVEAPTIGGASGHNFERDTTPHDPNDRYAPWDDRFGFRP